MFQRIIGVVVTILIIVMMLLIKITFETSVYSEFFLTLFAYILVLFSPGLLIDAVFGKLGKGSGEDIASRCGGLQYGGYLIGYMERSLIFLAFLISFYDNTLSYASILSFLSVIVAGKAIFRYSSGAATDRACADWYILGTFMSITMALAVAWVFFRFLLTG